MNNNNKARLTYRYDHPEQKRPQAPRDRQEPNPVIPLTPEEFTVVEEQVTQKPLNLFTTDFGSWSSPFDEETERVERMIRETGQSTIAEESDEHRPHSSRDHQYDQPGHEYNGDTGYYQDSRGRDGVTPNSHNRQGDSRLTVSGRRLERYSRTPWLKIVASVTGAITTGVLIGFFVLSLFSPDEPKDGKTDGTQAADVKTEQSSLVNISSNTETLGKPNTSTSPTTAAASASASIAVKVPSRTYTLLQFGAFQTQQGAEAAQAELHKLGLGAAVQSTDKLYVYAGLTPGPEEAALIKAKLLAQKTEVYVKTVTTPSVTRMKWSGKSLEIPDTYFTQAAKLTSSMINVTALHLKAAAPGPIENNTLQAIHSVHQTWSATTSEMASGMAEGQQAIVQKMNAALNTAVLALDEYKKNPSASFLWQAQSGIMQYILLESELLSSIAAS